jgi:hypothetical protein
MRNLFGDQSTRVISQIVPFKLMNGTPYTELHIAGHREILPIRGKTLVRCLQHDHYLRSGAPMKKNELADRLDRLETEAEIDGVERDVFLRSARHNGRIYIDLCDENWRAIEIDSNGWRVISTAPVRFLRTAGMRPLPEPVLGGSIDTLWQFVRVQSEADRALVIGHLLATLGVAKPTPILYLLGGQGTAKSTATELLRHLVDPHVAGLRSPPKSEQDLFIAAQQSRVLSFDNLSDISNPISDALCRIVTGATFATRQFLTNGEEAILSACNPILCNGIGAAFTRPDLVDRTIFVRLDRIPDKERKLSAEIFCTFEATRPKILGALCTALSVGLGRENTVDMPPLPRMGDFAAWAIACEPGFSSGISVLDAYHSNIEVAAQDVIEDDEVGARIRTMMEHNPVWEGTATVLDGVLRQASLRPVTRNWPRSPRALADHVRRLEPALAKLAIEVTFSRRGHNRERIITIEMTSNDAQN